MTGRQIMVKLQGAGIGLDGLTIQTNTVEVYCETRGRFSRPKTDRKMKEVSRALGFGGYRCAHGGWVLSNDFHPRGDWNEPFSDWHQ